MNQRLRILAMLFALTHAGALNADQDALGFHDDYYLGFSQGAYYGLMLAGIDYEVAWCVKGELDYAGAALGSGSEFQQGIEGIFARCNDTE